jgi:hypothetical protein
MAAFDRESWGATFVARNNAVARTSFSLRLPKWEDDSAVPPVLLIVLRPTRLISHPSG